MAVVNAIEALDLIVKQAGRGELIFPTNMAASLKLQHALDDPDCHLEAAADMVLAEPLIAARLVAIANSVAYTRFGGHVSNVRAAVSLLGFRALRTLVAAIVIRQLCSAISDPAIRHKAECLWQHCANVAVLAKVLAREFTEVDPETAMFTGIVHEIDGFYLLSRAEEFPILLDSDSYASNREARASLVHGILLILKIPRPVATAVESISFVPSHKPPVSATDVLSLANFLAATPSPLWESRGGNNTPSIGDMDFSVGSKTLKGVLAASADEIKSLTEALLI